MLFEEDYFLDYCNNSGEVREHPADEDVFKIFFDETQEVSIDDGNECNDAANGDVRLVENSEDEGSDFEGFESFNTTDEENNSSDGQGVSVNEPQRVIVRGRPTINRTGRPGRPRKQRNQMVCNATDENIPQTVEQATSSEDCDKWLKAMDDELQALWKNKTWSLVDLPSGCKAIPCKWVYAVKRNVNGEIERYKARLVAKGCNQRFGIDFHETFSPVVRYSTIRILLALAVREKMFLHQIDVSTAYLNSSLQDEIFMQQPPNFVNDKSPNKVLRLHKALYGLKQSGKEWNSRLDATLRIMDFVPCGNEPCLYKGTKKNKLVLIAVYVDDIIIGCSDKSVVLEVKAQISNEFQVIDKGQLRHFLGMEIEREGETGIIRLGQSQYIRDVLKMYGMETCKPLAVPLEAGYQVSCDDDSEKVDQQQYQSLVGTLIYNATSTRPDILHSVSKLAQRNSDPRKEHMVRLKHILRYLAGTINLKLIYEPNGNNLQCFVDADWGGNAVDRKSYTGFVFSLGGCPITWESVKQKSVALSSTEAEYMAASDASKEAIYLKRILMELNAWDGGPVVLHIDNQGAQKLEENPVYHRRSKHIDIRFHHIRDLVQSREIRLEYCPTANMIADVLTKNLSKVKHYGFMKLMNIR